MSAPKLLPARLAESLQEGVSVETAAAREGISASLGKIIVDDLLRRGALSPAENLCSSGAGACGDSSADGASLFCAGCPLAVK